MTRHLEAIRDSFYQLFDVNFCSKEPFSFN